MTSGFDAFLTMYLSYGTMALHLLLLCGSAFLLFRHRKQPWGPRRLWITVLVYSILYVLMIAAMVYFAGANAHPPV